MIATKEPKLRRTKKTKKAIPTSLIAEIMDGKPIYYKGYEAVLNGEKTLEDIIGASGLQGIIIEYLLDILFANKRKFKFRVLTNEQGLHLNKKNNMSADIAIYEMEKLPIKAIDKKYVGIPPKIQFEVDINVAAEDSQLYYTQKTQKLLNFGVEKVIWIFSESKTVVVATPQANWQVID
jgi:Uma2 family endonuclease